MLFSGNEVEHKFLRNHRKKPAKISDDNHNTVQTVVSVESQETQLSVQQVNQQLEGAVKHLKEPVMHEEKDIFASILESKRQQSSERQHCGTKYCSVPFKSDSLVSNLFHRATGCTSKKHMKQVGQTIWITADYYKSNISLNKLIYRFLRSIFYIIK